MTVSAEKSFPSYHRPKTPDNTMTSDSHSPEEKAAIAEFISAVKESTKARAQYAKEAPDAMLRLARAVYGHDNSQAQTVAACLASIYNGDCARPVQLDAIRHLDWSLLKDLLAVMIGTGHSEAFKDVDIRHAFEEVGGAAGVEWLHWYTTGGPHRAALKRLVTYIRENGEASSGRVLRELLASIGDRNATASIGRLNYLDDNHTKDFVLILDGLFGRDQGILHIEDITDALREAKQL